MSSALRMEDDVDPEGHHADETADDGAEKAVAAVDPGIGHIVSETEDGTDAGKGGIAVKGKIEQRTESRRQRRLDIPHPDVVRRSLRVLGVRSVVLLLQPLEVFGGRSLMRADARMGRRSLSYLRLRGWRIVVRILRVRF